MSFVILAYDSVSGALGAAMGAASTLDEDWRLAGALGTGIVAVYGPRRWALASVAATLLEQRLDPRDVVTRLLGRGIEGAGHQLFVVDARGRTAAYSGPQCPATFGHTEGTDHVAGGNRMASANVVGAMSLSFERSGGDPLEERLLLAFQSGERAGGDLRGTRSARFRVYRAGREAPFDLAVQDRDDLVRELRQQVREFILRSEAAKDPPP
jgi:uncharacterized Ntn-hydrolase superfamily protein